MARGLVRRVGSLALPATSPSTSLGLSLGLGFEGAAPYPGPGLPSSARDVAIASTALALAPATVGIWQVSLQARDKGIAPGQFAAFYAGGVCLGAGVVADVGGAVL